MICENCGKEFPSSFVINGKRRNFQRRKFCLKCSPFKKHNTRKRLTTKDGLIVCSSCGKEKEKSEFSKKGKRLHSMCKPCLYVYQMIRWNKTKVKAIKYKGNKCEKCGIENIHPVEYDFHHVGEKNDVWTTLRTKSWDKIKKEIDKCQLLCCGCHRKEHINKELWEFSMDF